MIIYLVIGDDLKGSEADPIYLSVPPAYADTWSLENFN